MFSDLTHRSEQSCHYLPPSLNVCLLGTCSQKAHKPALFIAPPPGLQPWETVPASCSVSASCRVHLSAFHVIWTRVALVAAACGHDLVSHLSLICFERFPDPSPLAFAVFGPEMGGQIPGLISRLSQCNSVPWWSLHPRCPFFCFPNCATTLSFVQASD